MSIKLGTIYNEDCIETMLKMPDNFIDLVITSPPYNCGVKYDIYNDNREWDEYLYWCEVWISNLYRVLKDTGRICINVLLEMGIKKNKQRVSPYAEFYHILKKMGFKPFGSPVWIDKHRIKYTAWGSWLSANAPYIYNPYEVILIAYKNKWERKNTITEISKKQFIEGCSGIWNLGSETKKWTQANFPEKLPEMCIRLLSSEGDLIYDPFGGSGTTCVVAKRLKRNWIMSEISEKYCKIAKNRIDYDYKQIKLNLENFNINHARSLHSL